MLFVVNAIARRALLGIVFRRAASFWAVLGSLATGSALAVSLANDISSGLIVTPGNGLNANGLSAGPFTLTTIAYLLSNAFEEPVAWALGSTH